MNNNYIVSVCSITYNQAEFISEAIESFLKQVTNFPFEIVISDDFSSDRTRSICLSFKELYPERISLFTNEKNIGIIPNFLQALKYCKGKYIALCEGDDYWIDPLKLQKQVDFLESNTDYGMVCTDYDKYIQNKKVFVRNCFQIPKYSEEVKFEDYILDRSTICTATTLFRKDLLSSYFEAIPEEKLLNWNVGDTPLWLYNSIVSKIKVLPDVTAIYRINQNSASKFSDIHKRYHFIIKGFEIPFFFLDFGNADDMLRKKMLIAYNAVFIKYRFDTHDAKIGNESYLILKEYNGLNFDLWIRYRFYKRPYVAKFLLFPLSYFIRKIKNLFLHLLPIYKQDYSLQ